MKNQVTYFRANVDSFEDITLPEGKRVPFGWDVVPVSNQVAKPTYLLWENVPLKVMAPARFRITVGIDVREEKIIEVVASKTQRVVGIFDIKYAYVFQIFEIELNQNDMAEIIRDGLELRMVKGQLPLWIFSGHTMDNLPSQNVLLPHLMVADESESMDEFYKRLFSISSIQQFGWMEGCVLDGIFDLWEATGEETAHTALGVHLQSFFTHNNQLVYENPRSEPVDGGVYGIEGMLPFAILAKIDREHIALDMVKEYCQTEVRSDGSIEDDDFLSAEGSYTVAYSLAVISKFSENKLLAEWAIKQLLIRKERLVEGNDLYLRCTRDGEKTFRNWGRAYAWYMLGLIRTISVLGDILSREILEQEFKRMSEIILQHQLSDGLWSCFLGEPETGVETSGAAGIATALAQGVALGVLPQLYKDAAVKTLDALKLYLTPDGLLTGVSQSNRAGELLQRNGYRVISQMGMGLMAQLIVAIGIRR